MNPKTHIETRCVQGGWQPKNGDPLVLPIFQSTTFKYDSADYMGRLFDFDATGHFYTRLSNPTLECVERKLADLEGGAGALLTASGQAATFYAVLNICEAGSHVVSSTAIYGGTFNLFAVTMQKMGIDFTFVDPSASDEELAKAFRPTTKLFFVETLSNPSLKVADLERLARMAHAHGVPLIVDNTFPTPILCRPLEWGADIVIHSTTKYMDGHAQSMGGGLIDGGTFDWTNGRFPSLCEPDPSYHGLVYTEKFGSLAYLAKARAQLLRDIGAVQSPFSAYILNLGLETLPLRMHQHGRNALAVARHLEAHPAILSVQYPGLESNPFHALAKKYLPDGACGVISFRMKAGREAAVRFMDGLKLAAIVTHVADARTSVLHPAGTTHRQLTDEQLAASGITPDLIRFSVGIEHIDDILADIDQALEAI
ncbi:MAG: O-acetylhomoserine aminocarboxypropyltransferase/cysteine synthase [Verrucomicrobiota bacterium]|nr:O-acetylhomoserine aminocarboxypropyltransferase/cysteine synthase [Verrucomicrobiota bacterium]